MYSNSYCSCLFEPEIIKIAKSSHKMDSNSILSFQGSTIILNACTKKSGNLMNSSRIYSFLLVFMSSCAFLSAQYGIEPLLYV